ncbi:hypothetical protein DYB32_007238 [Aphanomyces invadans]|uniref:Suppressor of forked domain-containing protein n=1 Tax=Aphanomyces invadans TaxID=157072 RepID=A0A3R6ZMB2_9STRA|nr:hypothetical protein DYB32_007238 [Aphanomyces invadans]
MAAAAAEHDRHVRVQRALEQVNGISISRIYNEALAEKKAKKTASAQSFEERIEAIITKTQEIAQRIQLSHRRSLDDFDAVEIEDDDDDDESADGFTIMDDDAQASRSFKRQLSRFLSLPRSLSKREMEEAQRQIYKSANKLNSISFRVRLRCSLDHVHDVIVVMKGGFDDSHAKGLTRLSSKATMLSLFGPNESMASMTRSPTSRGSPKATSRLMRTSSKAELDAAEAAAKEAAWRAQVNQHRPSTNSVAESPMCRSKKIMLCVHSGPEDLAAMSALMDGNPMLSDDSSEEDEPIAIPTQHTAAHVGGDVDMGGGADEDEDEDMAAADDPTAGKHPKLRRLVMYEVQQSFQHVEEARPFYVLFLEQFPTSNVRAIFTKALQEIKLPHVELWAFYLQFTKSTVMDVLTEANSPEDKKRARQQMTEAFESALDRVGTSIHSNGIWTQYLHFLKDDKRALPIPMHNLDALWKDYEQFEKSIPNNEALALNVFKVLRPKVDAAKAIFKDRKALVDPIDLDALPSRTNTDPQIDAWNKWIEFELANPERVERPKWKAKVRYVLEACLACRRYSAEVWFQYAMLELPDVAATSAIFQQALEAMPESCLLRFAYADHLESHGLVDDARAVYESLLEATASPIGYITYMRFARRAFGNKVCNPPLLS